MGIARSVRHSAHGTRRGKALRILCRIGCDYARVIEEVDFKRGVELEEAAKLRLPDVIEAGLEAVVAPDDGYVVAQLPLLLDRLLGNVGVRSKVDASRESECRHFGLGINQVVPILVAQGQGVNHMRGKDGVERCIADDEMVGGEVARS